jgi:apolipoprotein N-acyltransferase
MRIRVIVNILLSIASGILLALSFPKFNLFWLAWAALAPFFLALIRARGWKEPLACGLFFGISFFGIHLFWVMTLYRFVKWWIVLGGSALVVYQTLFILLFVVFSRVFISGLSRAGGDRSPLRAAANALVGGGRRSSNWVGSFEGLISAIGVAAVWTAVEWIRAWGPFGVSGGDVGYSQVQLLPLIQIAFYTSVYGVSFAVVLLNASLALFMSNLRKWSPLVFSLILILAMAVYGWQVMSSSSPASRSSSLQDVLRGSSRSLRLALIQPNVDQAEKLNQKKVYSVYRIQEEMTRQALRKNPEIIIWPETAVFTYLLHNPSLLKRVQQLAIDSGAWLILGTPHYVGENAYNSVISISPAGRVVSRYDKERLIPFGEYLPFRKILYPVLKGVGYYDNEFSSRPDPGPILVDKLKIAAAICFESTLPDLIRERVKRNSDFILLVTNDAWFDDSSALYFHLNTGVFRAIENRRYFVQVGNTGISAVVDPFGRVLKKTKVNQRETLFFEIPLS